MKVLTVRYCDEFEIGSKGKIKYVIQWFYYDVINNFG